MLDEVSRAAWSVYMHYTLTKHNHARLGAVKAFTLLVQNAYSCLLLLKDKLFL